MNGLLFSPKIFLGILYGGCQELAGCALIWDSLVQLYLKDLMSNTVQKNIRSEMVRLLFSVQKWAYINFAIKNGLITWIIALQLTTYLCMKGLGSWKVSQHKFSWKQSLSKKLEGRWFIWEYDPWTGMRKERKEHRREANKMATVTDDQLLNPVGKYV